MHPTTKKQCSLPKSDLETMQRQACVYAADGTMICNIKAEPVDYILQDKNTMFPNSVVQRASKVPASERAKA
jgi:hypothetical protein